MSDLFKDHGPELSDDEDRRLWQRVRTIPDEVAAPKRSPAWWTRLWAMPAVRYGAPAFAALLVAVVWVTERRPEPPAREAARKAEATRDLDQNELRSLPPSASTHTPLAVVPAPDDAPTASSPSPTVVREEGAAPKRRAMLDQAERAQSDEAAGTVARQDVTKDSKEDGSDLHARGGRANEVTLQVEPAPQALSKQPEQTFAAPPKEKSAASPAAPAPAPVGASTARKLSAFKASDSPADRLAAGTLPSRYELAGHAILTDVVGAISAQVRIPEPTPWAPEGGPHFTVTVTTVGGTVTAMSGPLSGPEAATAVPYARASAPAQVAVLAYLLERTLAEPSQARLAALKGAALQVDPAAGGYGRTRLLTLLDGALTASPASAR